MAGKAACAVCLLAVFLLLLVTSCKPASAQNTATLIVYVETQNGDGTFSFTGSPSPLGSFQIGTAVNGSGGAQIFNVPAGSYTITLGSLSSGWTLQEVFLNGTGSGTVNQQTATINLPTTSDVMYLRYTLQYTAPSATPTPASGSGSSSGSSSSSTSGSSQTSSSTSTSNQNSGTIQATTSSGTTVNLAINGNITGAQVSSAAITTNQTASTTTLSFTVTGESGTSGFCNITIPKTAVPYGSTPTVYVDNQTCQSQGYTQDANNYYLWYTVHFSTHQIAIVFTAQIPEFPTESFVLVLVVVVVILASATALLVLRKGKRFAPLLAVLLAACLLMAFSAKVLAEPDKFVQLGTSGDDIQVVFGTNSSDVIVEFGFGGNDTMYVGGDAGDDVIVQNGGAGTNTLTTDGGTGNDFIIEDGTTGNDSVVVFAGDGNDTILINGGVGGNNISVGDGQGNDLTSIKGGDGNDNILVDCCAKGMDWFRSDNDTVIVNAAAGNDNITVENFAGYSTVFVDGGTGQDALRIITAASGQNFTVYNAVGGVIYQSGLGGASITIANVEQITVYDPYWNILYKNY
jgi:hypothetical protein